MNEVFITDHIKDPVVERLILGDRVTTLFNENAEILLVWNQLITKKYLNQFNRLKSIIRCGVGYDIIDIEYAASKKIVVSNVPDYCTNEVADTAIAFILNIIRAVFRLDAIAKTHTDQWQDALPKDIRRASTQTVGIIGTGRIGSNAIKKLAALGITCVCYDPYLSDDLTSKIPAKKMHSLYELLNQSDIVSLHVPLTNQTYGMVDENFIKFMKPGASLVNTSRGKVIKDLDLIYNNLKSGHLLNVAFDVLPEEPPTSLNLIKSWLQQETWLSGRLIINPHASYYSQESYQEVREKAAMNALRVLNSDTQLNIVNC